jgi:hypothetical protein
MGKDGAGVRWSANCKATRNVPVEMAGLCPDMRLSVPVATDGSGFSISGAEVRWLKRYRESMRGAAYAASMAREAAEREAALWRSASPWIPLNKKGEPLASKSYNRADGIGERIYSDGTLLSERYRDWLASNEMPDHLAPMSDDARLREIDRLREESERETADERKRSRKVRAANIERTKSLRF